MIDKYLYYVLYSVRFGVFAFYSSVFGFTGLFCMLKQEAGLKISVPDPLDPHAFGPFRSVSTSQRYEKNSDLDPSIIKQK
jgi:hypothetical protein